MIPAQAANRPMLKLDMIMSYAQIQIRPKAL